MPVGSKGWRWADNCRGQWQRGGDRSVGGRFRAVTDGVGHASKTSAEFFCVFQDVDRRLAIDYTPVRRDGVVGATIRYITDTIAPALPMISHLEIFGDPEEGRELEILAQYYGGSPGKHIVQWLRRVERPDGSMSRLRIGKADALKYVPQKKDIGHVLEVCTRLICTPFFGDLRMLPIFPHRIFGYGIFNKAKVGSGNFPSDPPGKWGKWDPQEQ